MILILFLCLCVNETYWSHFGLNNLLNFARGSNVKKKKNNKKNKKNVLNLITIMKEVCILNTNANPNVINIYICWALVCINRLQSWILGTFRGHPQSLFHTKFNDVATQPYLLIFFFIKVLLVKSAQYFRGSGLLHRKSSPQNLFLFLQFKDHFHILAVFLINTVRADPKKKSSLYS